MTMTKKIIVLVFAALMAMPMMAQQKKSNKGNTQTLTINSDKSEEGKMANVYDEERDPMEQIETALEEARGTNRLVICQVGGNWCPWCLRFADFITSNEEIATLIRENFVYIHVNTSKEHKNWDVLKRLGNPGRFGYPVLVVLGQEGEVLHIQNTSYLEKDKSYDMKKVMEFFQNWTMKAIETVK